MFDSQDALKKTSNSVPEYQHQKLSRQAFEKMKPYFLGKTQKIISAQFPEGSLLPTTLARMKQYAFPNRPGAQRQQNTGSMFGTLPANYKNLVSSGVSRPHRNNNPLNIKVSDYTKEYGGVVGTDPSAASDGGHFLIFDSAKSGFDAAKRLLSTSGYQGLTVDKAMKRWSNSGYGGEILPAFKNRPMASLNSAERDLLVKAMARREGFS